MAGRTPEPKKIEQLILADLMHIIHNYTENFEITIEKLS